jgi:hypothetical protein
MEGMDVKRVVAKDAAGIIPRSHAVAAPRAVRPG